MKHSREITVGITTRCLHEPHPRGVVRAGRAVAERLAGRVGLRMLAISEPEFDSGELVCAYRELPDWLADNPLRMPEPVVAVNAPLPRAFGAGKRILSAVGLKRPGKLAYRLARRALGKSEVAPTVPHPPATEFVSLRDLNAILSFECYDPVWQWPAESYGCRMVGVFHDAIPLRINEGANWQPAEYLRAAALMALRAALVCCDSESTRIDLEAFFPAARGRTRVVPLGHDGARFRGARHAPRAGKRIAMVGDIEPRKNQAGVLRAARHVAEAHKGEKITLVLIGREQSPDPLAFLAREASRYVRLERTGYVDDADLPALLAGCDCFVYPSLWEGFGIPVLEAISAGVPVVCSDNSSLPEVAGPHAFYCNPYDPRSIAAGITRALALTPQERAAWTRAAREWAARFPWDATADRFHELLAEVTEPACRAAA